MELADMQDLKSCDCISRAGSSPALGTTSLKLRSAKHYTSLKLRSVEHF